MGYTIEKGKAVIWTSKIFIADEPWPNDDEGENYTCFYKNLYERIPFEKCPAILPDIEKKELVSKTIGLPIEKFILKSKKAHYKQMHKK